MKFLGLILFIVVAIMALQDVAIAQCIADRNGCQPDGSQGNCCSGFCLKLPNWVAGYCTTRNG